MRLIARFEPLQWRNHRLVPVETDERDYAWDVTHYVREEGLLEPVMQGIRAHGAYLDTSNVLKADPNAPDWVREWDGLFTVTVTQTEEGKPNRYYVQRFTPQADGTRATTFGLDLDLAEAIRECWDELKRNSRAAYCWVCPEDTIGKPLPVATVHRGKDSIKLVIDHAFGSCPF